MKRAKDIDDNEEEDESERIANKRKHAGEKMYNFYSKVMELSKREFLEDFVFAEVEKSKKKHEIYRKLVERNKTINTQINIHVRKSSSRLPVPLIIIPPPPAKSSGD